jgi:hypothetical protein
MRQRFRIPDPTPPDRQPIAKRKQAILSQSLGSAIVQFLIKFRLRRPKLKTTEENHNCYLKCQGQYLTRKKTVLSKKQSGNFSETLLEYDSRNPF